VLFSRIWTRPTPIEGASESNAPAPTRFRRVARRRNRRFSAHGSPARAAPLGASSLMGRGASSTGRGLIFWISAPGCGTASLRVQVFFEDRPLQNVPLVRRLLRVFPARCAARQRRRPSRPGFRLGRIAVVGPPVLGATSIVGRVPVAPGITGVSGNDVRFHTAHARFQSRLFTGLASSFRRRPAPRSASSLLIKGRCLRKTRLNQCCCGPLPGPPLAPEGSVTPPTHVSYGPPLRQPSTALTPLLLSLTAPMSARLWVAHSPVCFLRIYPRHG